MDLKFWRDKKLLPFMLVELFPLSFPAVFQVLSFL